MVRIRYADLPEGLYARAEAQGRHAAIYLRPGLTPAQRREGLRRARQTARMGYGPRLPAAAVEVAVATDRMRITMRNAIAAVRQHVVPSALLAVALATAVVSYVLFVSVSIRLTQAPPVLAQAPHPVPSRASAPLAPGTAPAGGGRGGANAPGPALSAPGAPGTARAPSPRASTAPGPTPPTPAPSPSLSPGPLPSPSPSSAPTCVNLSPLGICLSM